MQEQGGMVMEVLGVGIITTKKNILVDVWCIVVLMVKNNPLTRKKEFYFSQPGFKRTNLVLKYFHWYSGKIFDDSIKPFLTGNILPECHTNTFLGCHAMPARPSWLLWAETGETYIDGCKADLGNDTIVSSPGQTSSLLRSGSKDRLQTDWSTSISRIKSEELLAPALFCHKVPARPSKTPLRCFFMA